MKNTAFTKVTNDSQYSALQTKHQSFLKKFQQFPQNTRKSIYKQLLLLPLNHRHFQELSKPYQALPQHNLDKQVSYICKCLQSIYPQLNNQWIPGMIYPFVKLFKQDNIACFEISLTFLLNTFFPILQNYPQPSKTIMGIFEDHLSKLTSKIQNLDYPISSIINPSFIVSMTDILNKNDWLIVFDYLVTNSTRPWLYICIALVVIQSIQPKLLKMKTVQDIATGMRRQKSLKIDIILNQAERISQKYLQKFEEIYQRRFFPLPAGRYPVFSFINQKIRLTNAKIQHEDDIEIIELGSKMNQLEYIMNRHIDGALYSDHKDINDRYEMVEGQMQQYLSKIRLEHANKIKALREIQDNFNQQVRDKNDKRDHKNVMNAIERRARLEKQITQLVRQAQSIKSMQNDMVNRMRNVAEIKKKQLVEKSNMLKKANKKL